MQSLAIASGYIGSKLKLKLADNYVRTNILRVLEPLLVFPLANEKD